jgi:chorismate-pyruvate lyase
MTDYEFDLVRGFYQRIPDDRRTPVLPSLDLEALSPFVRALVTIDGSVTRYLETYAWEPIKVVVVEHGEQTGDDGSRILRRVVAMRGLRSSLRYAAAVTEMPLALMPDEFRPLLADAARGVGQVINQLQLDTHRRIRSLRRERCEHRASLLALPADAPVLVREYEIKRDQRAFAFIREVFPEERLTELGRRVPGAAPP